jgi:hypothetical protein
MKLGLLPNPPGFAIIGLPKTGFDARGLEATGLL